MPAQLKYLLISDPRIFAFLVLVAACLLCISLIALLLPVLRRLALAQPNHRSSHSTPTPQSGGLAVIIATFAVSLVALNLFGIRMSNEMRAVELSILFLMMVGFWDDMRPLGVAPRLVVQIVTVIGVLLFVPDDLRIWPAFNPFMERCLVAFALLWFVNLVNFMDGIDWLTVVELVPVTVALIIIGSFQASLPWETTVVAAVLCGALLGFAPFNKPVARLFLGDAGSLPIGLLLGWCLFHLAASGHLAAALLLPLYYLADGSVTLVKRIIQQKPFWESHREHFYQQAKDKGLKVTTIVRDVFLLNLFLGILSLITIEYETSAVTASAVITGGLAVVIVLWRLTRKAGA